MTAEAVSDFREGFFSSLPSQRSPENPVLEKRANVCQNPANFLKCVRRTERLMIVDGSSAMDLVDADHIIAIAIAIAIDHHIKRYR
jgi:hypothetical protein